MKIYAKCQKCNKKGLFVRKRRYKIAVPPFDITSQSELCSQCNKEMKTLAGTFKADDKSNIRKTE